MASNQDHTQDTFPSDPDASEKGMSKTLIIQGSILGVIVIFLVLASFFGLI